jgi:hypothetical protein
MWPLVRVLWHHEGDGERAIRTNRRAGERLLLVPGHEHLAAGSPPTALRRHERTILTNGWRERHRHIRVTGWRWWCWRIGRCRRRYVIDRRAAGFDSAACLVVVE